MNKYWKKILFFFIAIVAIIIAAIVLRNSILCRDFEYIVLGKRLVITDYKGTSKKVRIPKTIWFKPVGEIGRSAFEGNQDIEEVVLPDSVKKIGVKAFKDCLSLEKIYISHNIYLIDDYAFSNCTSLGNLDYDNESGFDGSIGFYTFENCTSLYEVDFHDKCVEVAKGAFRNCTNLMEINGSQQLSIDYNSLENTGIMNTWSDEEFFYDGDHLIRYLENASDVVVPDGITSISRWAFDQCSGGDEYSVNIESIHLPDSLTCLEFDFSYYKSSNKNNPKIKLYFGRPKEFCISENVNAADLYVFIAPADSIVIQYAKEHGIEYIVEE